MPIVSFWFLFIDCMLVYMSEYVFVWLYFNVLAVYIVLLYIRRDSCYTVSSTHWVATQHILGLPVVFVVLTST